MSTNRRVGRLDLSCLGSRKSRRRSTRYRRARFEWLEPRQVLAAPGLAALSDVTLLAGAPLNVALDGSDADGDTLIYSITSSNPAITATLLDPTANRSLRITVDSNGNNIHGDMVFQLFEQWAPHTTARLIDLVQQGGAGGLPFYDGLTFHRIIKDFMIQGGDPAGDGTGGSGVQLDDEFTPELQFTGSGLLATAKGNDDTNDSQFFITSGPTRWLDFQHTIFGALTEGDAIREAIEQAPIGTNDKPTQTVTISSISLFVDHQNRVLHLAAPQGTTGSSDITVTASDGNPANAVTRTFHVTLQADTNNNNPFLAAIAPVQTKANTAVSFQIPATDVEGDPIFYAGLITPANANLTVDVNSGTGLATVTPKNGFAGVAGLAAGVRATGGTSWDTQQVPVYVRPAAPTVALQAVSDTGASATDRLTSLNNGPGKTLQFNVSGTIAGAEVVLFADGAEIGRGVATGTSLVVTTNATSLLTDGAHVITARQTLKNQAVNVGNLHTSVDLASDVSATLNIQVDTAAPVFSSTPPLGIHDGQLYSYNAQTNEEASGASYQLTTSPTGMTIAAATGQVSWTPTGAQVGPQNVVIRATDAAGNFSVQQLQIAVSTGNNPPVANAQTLTTPIDAPKAITLTGDDGDAADTQSLTYAIVTQPTHGTLSAFDPATGHVTYTPAAGYVGPDSFTFQVTDDATAGDPPSLTSAAATVSLVVTYTNVPPTADPLSGSTAEDTALALTLTGNDGNPESVQTLHFEILTQPAHGTLSGLNASTGQVTYTPSANYNGPDSFTFRVVDQDGVAVPTTLNSAAATGTIDVAAVNDLPTATHQTVSLPQNTPKQIAMVGSDGDPELNQTLVFEIVDQPVFGTLSNFNSATGSVTYTPNTEYFGTDAFTFRVVEQVSGLASAKATVPLSILKVNAPPTANPQSVSTGEDTSVDVTLTGSDGDSEVNQSLTYTITSGPSHGRITGFNAATGRLTYVPNANANGADGFTFTVTDDTNAGSPWTLTSPSATVAIQVAPVDDMPRFGHVGPQTVIQGELWTLAVRAVDADAPADTVRYSLEAGGPAGVAIDPTTGVLRWNVPAEFPAGAVRLVVRATGISSHGQPGLSALQPIDITAVDRGALAFATQWLSVGRAGNASSSISASPLGPVAPVVAADAAIAGRPSPTSFQGIGAGPTAASVEVLLTDGFFSHMFGIETGWGTSSSDGQKPLPPASTANEGVPRSDNVTNQGDVRKTEDRNVVPTATEEPLAPDGKPRKSGPRNRAPGPTLQDQSAAYDAVLEQLAEEAYASDDETLGS